MVLQSQSGYTEKLSLKIIRILLLHDAKNSKELSGLMVISDVFVATPN